MAKNNNSNYALKARIVEIFGTNQAFAEEVGASELKVSQVIHGRRQLSIQEEHEWSVALGTTPARIGLDGPVRSGEMPGKC